MRRLPFLAVALVVAACSKPADKAAVADSTPAAPEAAPAAAGPRALVTVIYRTPKDTAAFETYYRETHVPLVGSKQQEIGFTSAELTRFGSALDGKQAGYYRQARLYFPSLDALRTGIATPGFKAVAEDLGKFETKGALALVATETGEASTAACPALVTVLYNTPKDTAAFESYYSATHLPLVGAGQQEIGFGRAELTRFATNLDGSAPPALYRQAILCFDSMDALKQGTATSAFGKVGGDLPNFATNGLTGLIGQQ
jgi:uncharacterized protein (TIGR02118 family)